MGFFDSMLEINNNFLLIGLIVVAITCIYLLYSNLTKVNDSASLKSTINNLIQQNKKRDEIINFLLERIENLEHALPKLTDESGPATTTLDNNGPVTNELDDLLDNIVPEPIQTVPANELTDLLESIHSPEMEPISQDTTRAHDIATDSLDAVPAAAVVESAPTQVHGDWARNTVSTVEIQATPAKLQEFSMDDLETEFEGMFDNVNMNIANPEVEQEVQSQSGVPDVDIVSVILEADDIGNMADYEINVADVPKSKDKLNAKYTVKQLKQIAQKMNLNAKGNKTDLVERIYAHLTASA